MDEFAAGLFFLVLFLIWRQCELRDGILRGGKFNRLTVPWFLISAAALRCLVSFVAHQKRPGDIMRDQDFVACMPIRYLVYFSPLAAGITFFIATSYTHAYASEMSAQEHTDQISGNPSEVLINHVEINSINSIPMDRDLTAEERSRIKKHVKLHLDDLYMLLLSIPHFYALYAFKAQIRALELFRPIEQRVFTLLTAEYYLDMLLGHGVNYIMVISFVQITRKAYRLYEPALIREYVEIGRKQIHVGNLELLGLTSYISLGLLIIILQVSGFIVAYVSSGIKSEVFLRLQTNAAHSVIVVENNLKSVNNFFSVVVFVSSQMILRKAAVVAVLTNRPVTIQGATEEEAKTAKHLFASTRYLLMPPLQLSVLQELGKLLGWEPPVARLLHASLLCYECAWVLNSNYRFWDSQKEALRVVNYRVSFKESVLNLNMMHRRQSAANSMLVTT